MDLLVVFLIIVVVFAVIVIAIMFVYISKMEAKKVGVLHINKDVEGFYLTELEFDSPISEFMTNNYITLRLDKSKNLYE